MRIAIDMQGAQSGSRFRDIGRYTTGLCHGLIRNLKKGDEILFILNGCLTEGLDDVLKEFRGLVPDSAFKIWRSFGKPDGTFPATKGTLTAIEAIHARFIESLAPDAVIYSSLFDDPKCTVAAPKRLRGKIFQSAICYDFIPLHDDNCLQDSTQKRWCLGRLEQLKSVDLTFAVSDAVLDEVRSRSEGQKCESIGADASEALQKGRCPELAKANILPVEGAWREVPFVLCLGASDRHKNLNGLVESFRHLPEEVRKGHQLVIVCDGRPEFQRTLPKRLLRAGLTASDFVLLSNISDDERSWLYEHCATFVFPSLDEGFCLPVLDAMKCGAPVIAANVPAISEAIGLSDALFDPTDVTAMADKLNRALTDEDFAQRLRDHGQTHLAKFSWDETAKKLLKTLRRQVKSFTSSVPCRPSPLNCEQDAFDFCEELARACPSYEVQLADALDKTFVETSEPPIKQLFVDISELHRVDSGTGIQRVTRTFLEYLMAHPPEGYAVRPIYTQGFGLGYRYAHKYVLKKFGMDDGEGGDFGIHFSSRDVFFGLDYDAIGMPIQLPFLKSMERRGVKLCFFIHDLIPHRYPDLCHPGTPNAFNKWLPAIAQFHGILCNSKSTADDYTAWLKENAPERVNDQWVKWGHLGCDIKAVSQDEPLPISAQDVLEAMKSRTTFLAVSTVEPRKRYDQILGAFERLWAQGVDANLVIVGREGWNVQKLCRTLNNHPEMGQRLFWLKGISDAYLEKVYQAADAVIMASVTEGFGLAVVEGAQHQKPLILRDIPIFREIAHDSAFYFQGFAPQDLADAIQSWLKLFAQGQAPSSQGVEQLSWDEACRHFVEQLPLEKTP